MQTFVHNLYRLYVTLSCALADWHIWASITVHPFQFMTGWTHKLQSFIHNYGQVSGQIPNTLITFFWKIMMVFEETEADVDFHDSCNTELIFHSINRKIILQLYYDKWLLIHYYAQLLANYVFKWLAPTSQKYIFSLSLVGNNACYGCVNEEQFMNKGWFIRWSCCSFLSRDLPDCPASISTIYATVEQTRQWKDWSEEEKKKLLQKFSVF